MTQRLRSYIAILLGLVVVLASCRKPVVGLDGGVDPSSTAAPTPFGAPVTTANEPVRFGAFGVGSAAFSINTSTSFPVATTAAATVTLQLLSVNGVRPGVQWSFVGKSDSSIAYPTITSSGSPPGSTATFTMPSPSTGPLGLAFTIKCVINGGLNDNGQIVAGYSATGVVGTLNANNEVPWSYGETLERGPIGVADMINRQLIAGGSGDGGSSSTSNNIAVADLAALRAVASGTRFEGIFATVASPLSTWQFSTSSGAGFADDGNATTGGTVIKPTDVLLAANGRWYNSSPGPVVPTIAALRLAVAGKHPLVQVQAYSSLGDGGGGDFTYDPADTTSTDNIGTLVVAGARRYKRVVSGHLISVKWFGARGDYEQYTDGQNVTAGDNQVEWRAYASVPGAGYIGKHIEWVNNDATIYTGTITAWNDGTHKWTVVPTPSKAATNKANLYATNDTVAFQAAHDFANTLTNQFYALGYDLRSARLLVPRGTYYVPSSITGMPCGMTGDNAAIRGTPGTSNLFAPVVDEFSGKVSFDHLVFYNFHTVIKSWASSFNGLQANVTFHDVKFQNVDYVIANTRNGNLFVSFDHDEFENSRIAKGFWAIADVTKPVGTSFAGTPPDNFTPGTEGDFTDGLFLVGGTEDAVLCPAGGAAAITIDGLSMSPHVAGGGAVDGQAWIIARRLTNISITGSRFGGELAGMPLIRLEEEASPADGSADGSNIAITGGTLATSSVLPAIVFADAAPIRMAISADSEIGNFGAVGERISITATAYDKLAKRTTNWLEVALDRVGSVPNYNIAAIQEIPGSSGFPSTQILDLSRTFSSRERLGFPNQNYDTSGTVFDTSNATANTASTGTAFNVLNISSIKYYSNNGSRATGTLTKWFPESLTAGWYTAILPYRTKGLGTTGAASFQAHSCGAACDGTAAPVPTDIPLEDTDGEIASASFSWYHDGGAVVHTHPLVVTFNIPTGGSSTNFAEFAAASLVKGKWGGNYIPKGGVPMPNWQFQGAKSWDPPSTASGAQTTTTVTTTGAVLGDRVRVSFSADLQATQLTGYVSVADTVTVVLKNDTGSTIDLGSAVLIAEAYRFHAGTAASNDNARSWNVQRGERPEREGVIDNRTAWAVGFE